MIFCTKPDGFPVFMWMMEDNHGATHLLPIYDLYTMWQGESFSDPNTGNSRLCFQDDHCYLYSMVSTKGHGGYNSTAENAYNVNMNNNTTMHTKTQEV